MTIPVAAARLPAAVTVAAAITATAALYLGALALRMRHAERTASAPVHSITHAIPATWAASPSANALVVFGAGATASGPSPELCVRLDHALKLWHMGVATTVMVGGGIARGIDENEVMAAYLVDHGLPPDAVIPARPADNTRVLVRTLAQQVSRRYVAVSSPFHAFRIKSESRRRGLQMTVSTPPSTPETEHRRSHRIRFMFEMAAVLWYALPPAWVARVPTGPGSLRQVLPLVLAGRASPSALLHMGGDVP